MLRNELRDRLTPDGVPGQPRWRLDVTLKETTTDLVILRDATSTFAKYVGDARWVLIDLETDAPALRGRSRRIASYSNRSSEFAWLQAEAAARHTVVPAIDMKSGGVGKRGSVSVDPVWRNKNKKKRD